MRGQPVNRISENGLKVWRLYGIIQTGLLLLVAIGVGVMVYIFEGPWWIYAVATAVVILFAYFFIYLFPKVRWMRWRYEVRESEIELQHGIFIVKRTLIPMVRVQHVDTAQGPILRKYNLAEITISTAATNHTIPALVMEEADGLRSRISALARVAEEDV
jgi:membrane protein YdbS with pleckstrin-like domain